MAYDFSYLLMPEFTRLLATCAERGWVTHADFATAIPFDLDPDELEDLYAILSKHGIRLVDDEAGGEG